MPQHYSVQPLKVQASLFKNYTYIIVDHRTRDAAVVDPAWELDTIAAALRRLDVGVKAILLTHSHFDHVNLVDRLADRYAPTVYLHRTEIDFYRYACRNLVALGDGDTIAVGATEFRCFHTPGHTAGSLCYLAPDSLFSGDTLFTEGCGVCDTYGGSASAMFRSMQYLKAAVADHVAVYPGHSFGKEPGHTFAHLRQNNVYLNITDERRFVEFRNRPTGNPAKFFDFQ
jgi:glyoxylase-like metal-dependent hydrolase (beta-lactamase superfamily II)